MFCHASAIHPTAEARQARYGLSGAIPVNNYMREKLSENTTQVYMNSVYCCYVLFPRDLFAEMWILNIKIERMMPYESTPHAPPHSKIHPEEQADTAAHGHGQGEGRWFHE